jgi:23S rRNA pseudouridine2605 synthase
VKTGLRKVALVRALSKLGHASRSQAYALVRSGKVEVDGRLITDPAAQIVPGVARIGISGAAVQPAPWRCIALNKPRRVVTTRRDPEGRTTVYDLIRDLDVRVVPVGRLDLASTGLLLMTSDTRLADWLTAPQTGITRRYVVTVRGELSDRSAQAIQTGVDDRGETLEAASIQVLKRSRRETHLLVELTEGRNREIRRLMNAVGHEVTRLTRIAYGAIELGDLAPGRWRTISREEMLAAFPNAPLRT